MVAPALGVPPLGPSGASAHLRGLAWAAHEAGHTLRLVAARASDHRGVHGAMPVPIETAPVPGWPSWLRRYRERREAWVARRLAEVARRGPTPDLIYERWSLFADVGARARRATGALWVLEVNAPLLLERERFEEVLDRAYAERWQRRVLLDADHLIAVSPWLARWLVDGIGVSAERVSMIPNGTASWAGDRLKARAALGLGSGDVLLGFLGSMKPWHGVGRLAGLLDRMPEARLLLVGANPPAALAEHPRVICAGQVPEAEAADLVAAMDVGLAPYPADAPPWFCPLKVLACRAQGTPVVASDVGELAGLVGEGGSLVPPGDDDALAAACAAWVGRRAPVHRRTWGRVLEEILEAVR